MVLHRDSGVHDCPGCCTDLPLLPSVEPKPFQCNLTRTSAQVSISHHSKWSNKTSTDGLLRSTFQAAVLTRLRLRSSSSQTSASWLRCGGRGEPGTRSGTGLFSTSLSCSSCRTSSVFSFSRSPGIKEAFAILQRQKGAKCCSRLSY